MIRRLLSLFVACGCVAMMAAEAQAQSYSKPYPTLGKIERVDPALDKLVPADAKMEIVASGFTWAEGPLWIKSGGYILFCDIPRNSVFKWKEGEGISLFLHPSGYTGQEYYGLEPGSNGLLLSPKGEVVSMEHGDRRVSVLTKGGGKRTLVDNYMGKRLNSPNDGAFKSNGDLYFTDPPYGLPKNVDDPAKELPFQGVYRLKPTGELTLLTKEMSRPNGIGFSPDYKTLYVANSDPAKSIWMAFPVKGDGTLGEGKLFFDSTPQAQAKKPGLPDGLKVDAKGNLFATGPGGVYVFAPDGKHLGTLATGVPTANCAFGDDGATLYITANDKLVRVRTATKGLGF